MDWENKLLATPVDHWIIEQAVVFDWVDGPRQGVCSLRVPSVEFYFDVVDEQYNPDGLDLMTFGLKAINGGSVSSLLAALQSAGLEPPDAEFWVPIWKFSDDEKRQAAEMAVERVCADARSTNLLVSSAGLLEFGSCWNGNETKKERVSAPLSGSPATKTLAARA